MLKPATKSANAFKNTYGANQFSTEFNGVDTTTGWKPEAPELSKKKSAFGGAANIDYSSLFKKNTDKTIKDATKVGDDAVKALGNTGKSGFGNFMKNSGAQVGVAAAANIGGAVFAGMDDGRTETYSGKEMGADIGNSALQGAASGMAFGPWGAAAGAVVGGVTALIGSKKKKKDAEKAMTRIENTALAKSQAETRASYSRENASKASNSAAILGFDIYKKPTGYGTAKRGGVISPYAIERIKILSSSKRKSPIFKKGGKLKHGVNIIPNGVLHEEKNSLGDKGLPVVKCDKKVCTKEYEIEKEELILALSTSTKIDRLAKGGKLKQLGEFLTRQLFNNTHSFSDKYVEFNKLAN